ncbi:MAG: FAD-dependent monooxygenase [Calditrichaeota bacterium]|nr:FAD-dependent monooxygenase [Calditrichota bacterium]
MIMEDIIIIGAGIAGLSTAIALDKKGKKPFVYEAAAEIKAVGAGIGMGANAMMAFDHLGIKEEVIAHAKILDSFTILDQNGTAITKTDFNSLNKKYGVSNFSIHRAKLHKILLSKFGQGKVLINKKVLKINQKKDSVTIQFNDGTETESRYVIAADGIHSQIRKSLLPKSTARYAGYSCWRGVIKNKNLTITESSETWGSAGRFGIVPLPENELYFFACVNGPSDNQRFQNYTIDDLREIFKNFHDPIQQILQQTKPENLIWNDINDIRPLDNFAFGNIVLIGDAAHATTPNLGQGACQAIEDAVILADEIQKNTDYRKAFVSFEKRRLKRTKFVIETSGRIGKIAQLSNPLMILLRNTFLRLMPQSVNNKQLQKIYTIDF